MICTNCGTENRVGAKFCSECATPLAVPCPNCGFANGPGAKFCSECATPLAAGTAAVPGTQRPAFAAPEATPGRGDRPHGTAPVAERRLVSILFADLVGFTPFAAERDAEDVRETLTRYFDLARDVIGRYGGTVEKFIGDAVMAVWGAPIAREDDAERAVRAGLELVDAVRALGPGIQARCGVLTGETAVTIGATNQGMVAGDIVNTASRLQSAAQPGTVLVGESTQRSASQAIVFEAAGDQILKGKAAPVPAWRALRVVAERGGRNRSDTLEAPFVGRDEELRQLKDLFHAAARERKPRLVSVIGPAGIGKHRLAWEFLKYVDGLVDLAWWHAGRSPAYGDGITFWALGEMVRARAGLRETDDEATSRAKIAATVREHVPDPEEQRWIESALLALLGLESSIGAEQLFAAWRTFFERLAMKAPVIMVFEDFHHADSGLLDFVDHLMEWSRGVPITVLTLARPELLERRPDWGAGKRTFAGIHLEPLPPAAMRELLAGLIPGLPTPAVEAIVSRADGVPLYAVETVRMLLAQGRLVLQDGAYRPTGELDDVAVPETLTALIAARLDGLEPTDRALVEDASVLGQSFTLAGLSAVSGIERAELEPRLRSLVRRELMVLDADPRSPERGQYRFVQALIREVAYNTLARKDRKVRHLAAARFFESLGTDELAGGLAGHYLAAQRLAQDDAEAAALAAQARIALRGAADRASALGSHAQAIVFLEQALEVTSDAAERADLHGWALAAASQGLDPDLVMRHAEAALSARRETGDRPGIAIAIAGLARATLRYRIDPERALTMLTKAWEEFSDLDQTPAGVTLMAAIAQAHGIRNQTSLQLEWTERVLPVAERLRLLEPICVGLTSRGAALVKLDRPREGLIDLRGAHQLATAHGFQGIENTCRILLTFYEQWDDPAAGLALAREGLDLARKLGSQSNAVGMIGNGTVAAIRVGEWDWAASQLGEMIAGDTRPGAFAEFFADRAVLSSLRGEDPSADLAETARLRAEITDPQYESYELWARAWAGLSSGRFKQAQLDGQAAVRITDFFRPLAWPVVARAALWDRDIDGARAVLTALDASGLSGSAIELDRTTIRAGIAAIEGSTGDAAAGYRDAFRGLRALDLTFDAALAALDMTLLLVPSDRETAELTAAVETALETFTRLGARPFLQRLETALADGQAADARPSRSERVVKTATSGDAAAALPAADPA